MSYDDLLDEKLETNISQKLLTGKKTNVQTVFKRILWEPPFTVMDSTSTFGTARERLNRVCEKLLRKEVADRSIESWIIALLSILMPSHSTLLYAKSIAWAKLHGWDDNQIGGIYATHFISFAVACIFWAQILQYFSVGLCVSVSSLFHMISIFYFTNASDSGYYVAVLIAAATGLISSANGPVFTAAMFFDELDGGLASKMRNFGWIEGSRTIFSGVFQGIIIYDLLAQSLKGRDSASLTSSKPLMALYMVFGVSTIFGSTLLLLGMKEKTKATLLPKVKLSSVHYFKTFSLLSLSSILEGFISYPTLFVVSWLLMNGYSPEETGTWVIASSIIVGFAIYVFSLLFTKLHEAPKCIGVLATHFPNPVLLQALIMMAAPNISPDLVLVLLLIASFLIKLKGGLTAVLKLHVLQSRWKVVTFSCYELFFTNIASAASPFVIRSMANAMNLSLNTVGPGTSAEASAAATLYTTLPFVMLSFILHLLANQYAFLDISDIYTKVDWTDKK